MHEVYEEFYRKMSNGRCHPCKYARMVFAAPGNFAFLGCYHEPYHGKRVAEIKDCPKCDSELEGR